MIDSAIIFTIYHHNLSTISVMTILIICNDSGWMIVIILSSFSDVSDPPTIFPLFRLTKR